MNSSSGCFAGREWDYDTKLQYNRARWYNPATGRWMSEDPLGFSAGDTNVSRYVHNGTTRFTDASGEEEKEDQAFSPYGNGTSDDFANAYMAGPQAYLQFMLNRTAMAQGALGQYMQAHPKETESFFQWFWRDLKEDGDLFSMHLRTIAEERKKRAEEAMNNGDVIETFLERFTAECDMLAADIIQGGSDPAGTIEAIKEMGPLRAAQELTGMRALAELIVGVDIDTGEPLDGQHKCFNVSEMAGAGAFFAKLRKFLVNPRTDPSKPGQNADGVKKGGLPKGDDKLVLEQKFEDGKLHQQAGGNGGDGEVNVDVEVPAETSLDKPSPTGKESRPGLISGNPENRLIETGKPLKNGDGWQKRWIRITKADELAQRTAIADYYEQLIKASSGQATKEFLLEQMSKFRTKWLSDFLQNRPY